MPLPLSAVIQQHIQQWHQSAAAVVHLVQSAIALHSLWILVTAISYLKAHRWRMGLRAYPWTSKLYLYRAWCPFVCYVVLAIELWGMGYGDSKHGVTLEEQLAIFLYMCVIGLSVVCWQLSFEYLEVEACFMESKPGKFLQHALESIISKHFRTWHWVRRREKRGQVWIWGISSGQVLGNQFPVACRELVFDWESALCSFFILFYGWIIIIIWSYCGH